ncbi:MAG TPA: sodium-dependent bicarbonate transport family permease [Candidatus Competibacteraceae bacterium]|nr:MAG: sodium-dependent bicarbonate transport family permease [Candidatus Competibacteraceae bacterium]HQC72570.1 sodium-dependent bicarbonate transport family permease [Candidatus Competibacteraceae bacterium]
MDIDLILSNFLNPPILFFFLGMLAVFLHSDLEIPQPIAKFLSLYLLLAIGFKGGVSLYQSGINYQVAVTIALAMLMASVVPLYSFFILRWRLGVADAAAIAATYGSISAVTFITATSLLTKLDIDYGGHLVAAMALMESPAIIIGVLFYRLFRTDDQGKDKSEFSWSELLRDAFFNGSVLLLIGSLAIGAMTGESGKQALQPFTGDLFKGLLAFFLLDMGLVAARRLRDLRKAGIFLVSFGILVPLLNAALGLGVAYWAGLPLGDAFLFVVLCASASYIAVPAAVRLAIPEANPSLYVPMSLAITFPFNIIVGLPLYLQAINHLWR